MQRFAKETVNQLLKLFILSRISTKLQSNFQLFAKILAKCCKLKNAQKNVTGKFDVFYINFLQQQANGISNRFVQLQKLQAFWEIRWDWFKIYNLI